MASGAGLIAAALASLAINGSYLIQHAGLATAPRVHAARPLQTLRGLLGSPAWRAGAVLGYGGLALEAAGLLLAPVALVQTVVAAGLVVVAVGSARRERRRVVAREALALGLMALALGALAIAPAPSVAGHTGAGALAVFLAAAAAVGLILGRSSDPGRLGLAAGVLYGGTTVALAAWLAAVRTGAWLGPPALVAAVGGALVTAGGFFAFQHGLQLGRPVPVVTLMTAATNAVAIAGGLLLLGNGLGETLAQRALHLAAFVLVPLAAALAAPGLVRGAIGDVR